MQMPFLYGLLTMAVFFCALMTFFYLGIRFERQKKPPDKVKETESNEEDEKLRKRQKALQEDFVKIMNYDVSQATARKKVT